MTQVYTPAAPTTSATPGSLPWAPLAVWAFATLGALSFVLFLGTNAPYADEWEFVPALVGDEPQLPWLWQQHNEHRLPLPRVVVLGLFKVTHDFRAGSLLQVVMLSGLALYLMRRAAKLRGATHWADAFFPISLLHIGHWENFVMGYQVCFVLFAVFATSLAVVALRATRANAFRSGLIAGALLMLIALTGGSGLAVVPAVALWLVVLAVSVWQSGAKGKAVLLLLVAALPFAYLAGYFVGYHRPGHHPPPCTDPLAVMRVGGEVLAVSIGIGVREVWFVAFPAVVALGIATLVLLLRKWKEPGERLSIVGLIAVVAGVTGVAVAIGVGRGEWGGGMGLWSRYSLLVWPLLATAYLVWVKYGSAASQAGRDSRPVAPRAGLHGRSKWVPIGLCVAAALAFPANTGFGMVNGAKIAGDYSDIAAQAKSGASADEIVRGPTFADSHHAGQADRAARAIPLLQRERIGIFARQPMLDISLWWWFGGAAALVALAALGGRWLYLLGHAVHVERCRELFRLQHERFEEQLLKAAAATGLPRGLRWVSCHITGDAVLVRDTATAGIVALVPVLIDFAPVEGSDMEDVPAAKEPRPATAVFTFHGGAWHTAGRVVFNHNPDQTIDAFTELQRLPDHV